MTSNNNLKTQARAYAAEKGISYVQARKEILADAAALLSGLSATGLPLMQRRLLTIQQEVRPDGRLPYPFHIGETGFVDRQDFWRGEPFRLIGFTQDPEDHTITVRSESFLSKDSSPTDVIGMHPVFADIEGNWATYRGAVEDVTTTEVQIPSPFTVQAHVTDRHGDIDLKVGVGHLMHLLNDHHFDGDPGRGRVAPEVAQRMLGWLNADPGGQDLTHLERLWSWLEEQSADVEATLDRDDIDETGFDDYGKALDAAIEAAVNERWQVRIDHRDVQDWARLMESDQVDDTAGKVKA